MRLTFNRNGGRSLRLLREPARWCAIFALHLLLAPTVFLLAVASLLHRVLLAAAEVLADWLDLVR